MPDEICDKCGNKKTWLFFDTKGSYWMCDCEVDLDGGTLFPWGMSSFLDERMEWLVEELKDA